MKKQTGKHSKPDRLVKDEEVKTITEIQECRKRWVEHREKILNRLAPLNPPEQHTHTHLPIDFTLPTIEEIRMATRQISSGKAARPDNIPAEVRQRSNCKHVF
ncbi:unnamed protein product [Schistosoma mattheei]|uniref:Uncharacterized protein n=1 Tax=Schistosoma mattheei TaxID=31246 RepID=A0A183PGU0_9TREM|nr:unnamed protein product [Schistosoma mattheei]